MADERLTKKDLRKVYNTWVFSTELSNSYDRMQALGFTNAIAPALSKLYEKKEDLIDALKRHMTFYNSEGTFGSLIMGISLSMEEQKARGEEIPGEAITGIKTGLMGPVAGLGDTIVWGTLKPIVLALACTLALSGNPLGALILFIFPIICYFIGWYCIQFGYRIGKDSVVKLMKSGAVSNIITGTSILGLFMMGALSSAYVKVQTPLQLSLSNAASPVVLQDILDSIAPGLLPLAVILGIYYYFTHKGQNYNKVILTVIVVSMIAAVLGVLAL